jgi:methionine-R-sulfoxide reductase
MKSSIPTAILIVIFALAVSSLWVASDIERTDISLGTVSLKQNTTMKEKLPPEVFRIMYEKGTERAFSSPLHDENRPGVYVSADTGIPLFRSEDKFDSGTGWPSFTAPIEGAVRLQQDNSLFMRRTEVVSADTGAHLGHVFNDGPEEKGGKRYCMNGLALKFIPDEGNFPEPTD